MAAKRIVLPQAGLSWHCGSCLEQVVGSNQVAVKGLQWASCKALIALKTSFVGQGEGRWTGASSPRLSSRKSVGRTRKRKRGDSLWKFIVGRWNIGEIQAWMADWEEECLAGLAPDRCQASPLPHV